MQFIFSKMFKLSKYFVVVPYKTGFCNKISVNNFFGGLVVIWNMKSRSRIKLVGPDRACAEWLMRNGAFIKWQGGTSFIKNYNSLPLDERDKSEYRLKEIDATDASLCHHGFAHFDGCKYIDKIKLADCYYIGNKAIYKLNYLKDSLKDLEIISCQVSDDGLRTIQNLKNLKRLYLGNLCNVENIDKVTSELVKALPGCEITVKNVVEKSS